MPEVAPKRVHRLFLSYAHDEHAPLAVRLVADLRARGFEVWVDEDGLRPGRDWETDIEAGLRWLAEDPAASAVVLRMTPHAVRRPDGFCLNELSWALAHRLPVMPVMLVWCEVPLSICRIQWLDMQDCVPIGEGGAL